MSDPVSIAVVGDHNEAVLAHRCIPRALELAAASLGRAVRVEWIHTSRLKDGPQDLRGFSSLWLAPASPYASTEGALHAVRWAREQGVPFFGTCGGFQHAILEFARHVANLPAADHTEINPLTSTPVISALSCSLVETTGWVDLVPGTRLQRAYGVNRAPEGYHCRYGVNTAFRDALEKAGFIFSAFDEAREIRGAELSQHPFFLGTLFQHERSAAKNVFHPVIAAFVAAAAKVK